VSTFKSFGSTEVGGLVGKALANRGASSAGREAVESAGASCKRALVPNSFAPGTAVLMANGETKKIEDVKLGDWVLATDPTTGKTGKRRVTALIVAIGEKPMVELTVDIDGKRGNKTASVTATAGHPFWVPRLHKWVEAGKLASDSMLRTGAGTRIQVKAVKTWTAQAQRVHNLTVDGLHTYYVLAGKTPVLVHNTSPVDGCGVSYGPSRAPTTRGNAGKVPPVVKGQPSSGEPWTLEGRLDDAQDLMNSQMRAQHHPEQPMRRAWSGGVNTETGDVAVACSGGGFCAEGNVVNKLGGDSSKVALLPSQQITSRNPFESVPKPACARCQDDYTQEQYPRGGYN
jgi:hypothetical protein